MIVELLQLILLFFVIFDPPASFAVFISASSHMRLASKRKMASLAVLVAAGLSFLVLFFGESLLYVFSTTIDEFRIAGGIILLMLGIRMSLGLPLLHMDSLNGNSGKAIASLIGTPLLTGPAGIKSRDDVKHEPVSFSDSSCLAYCWRCWHRKHYVHFGS